MTAPIHWTESEWKAVAAAFHAARLAGANKGEAVKKAVLSLPEGRRRSTSSDAQTSNISKTIAKLPRLPVPPAQSPEPSVPVAANDGFDALPAALRAVARKVADEIAHEIFQSLKGRLQGLATDFVKKEALPRPRVLVVGPIAHQQRVLEQEFGEVLDLRFVASNEPPRRVKEIAPSCARVLLWTNYINHAHQEQVAAALPLRRDAIQLVSGGVESLKDALLKMATL